MTILGVAAPGALILTTRHQSQVDLFLPWSSKAACPWRPAIILALGPPGLAPEPPPPEHNGLATLLCPYRPWSPVQGSRSSPTAAPAGPSPYPSSGPWRQTRRWDSYPPWYQHAPSGNFSKISFPINPVNSYLPRVMGPRAARISNWFGVEGLTGAGRLPEYPSGSVTCLLRRHSASTQGLGLSLGALPLEVPPGGEFAQEKGDASPGRFQPAGSFRCQPYFQGLRYTDDTEKLAEGRLVASK